MKKNKKKKTTNYSGIVINDSIVLAVEKKIRNNRKFEASLIAAIGFTSIICSFFSMFAINCNMGTIFAACVIFSVIYCCISCIKGKALLAIPALFAVFGVALYLNFSYFVNGFKLVFNKIYRVTNSTEISYFKGLSNIGNERSTTIFLVFCIWFIAFVIYFFTIYKPSPVAVVSVSFPILEIGLYYGIEVSVFWGILLIAYWIAILAMCCCDMGEYNGGTCGFTRKENTFFPKRSMKFKVTEKCALNIIAAVVITTLISIFIINITGYERNDKLNKKRVDLKDAINSFTIEDLESSFSGITEALGITLDYEDHRLGNKGNIKYKNTTDLTVTFSNAPESAIYLKGYVGSVYKNNEWRELGQSSYDEYNKLFSDFEEYNIYPQEFLYTFNNSSLPSDSLSISIENGRKKKKNYIPYGLSDYGDVDFSLDTLGKYTTTTKYSSKISAAPINSCLDIFNINELLNLNISTLSGDSQLSQIETFCDDFSGYLDNNNISVSSSISSSLLSSDNNLLLTSLLENEYRKFVYDNYLTVPKNDSFEEVYNEFSDILNSSSIETSQDKLNTLSLIREKISSMTTYTLSPGKTPSNRDFVNYFLLENQKGYCVYYATAGVMLARMAGIPARYATGYIIVNDDFNSDSQNSDGSYTIDVKDSRSHAWSEVYIDGYGWVPFEFTSGFSDNSIQTETAPAVTTTSVATQTQTATQATAVNSSKSSKSSSNVNNQTSTVVATTTSSNDNVQINPSGSGAGKASTSSMSDKNQIILYSVVFIVSIILFIILRRRFIIMKRIKGFRNGNYKNAAAYIYDYSLQLLKQLNIEKKNKQYLEFANEADEKLRVFELQANSFTSFTETTLRCMFGNDIPDKSDIDSLSDFAKNLAEKIYENSNTFEKIYLKIVLVLI